MKFNLFSKKLIAISLAGLLSVNLPFTAFASVKNNNSQSVSQNANVYFDNSFYLNHKDACDYVAKEISNFNPKINISHFNVKRSEVVELYRQVQRSHPEFFYISPKMEYNFIGTDAYEIMPIYTMTKAQVDLAQNKIDVVVKDILSKCKNTMTDFEKALVVHDYIVLNCEYDYTKMDFTTTILDCLINKKSGCTGYACAFSYILKKIGINTEFVMSEQMVHAWNKVEINGKYYNVDLTWDDPMNDQFGHVSHEYFMWSDAGYQSNGNLNKHYNYTVTNFANDNKFDGNYIHNINNKFCFVNNSCYTIDNIYGNKYEKSLIEIDPLSGNVKKVLSKLNDVWYISGFPNMYWMDAYYSIADFDGNLFYSTTDCVYQYNFATGGSFEIIPKINTSSRYYIYGMDIDTNGNVIVAKCSTPESNATRTIQVAKTIKKGEPNPTQKPSQQPTQKPTQPQPTTKPIQSNLKGDVDGDGVLTILDVTQVQMYCAKLTKFSAKQTSLADYDKDGIIDVMDATLMQMVIAKII